eukprot:TRINITY_DN2406_c0_g1_i1.p1 TRINITY_DN2406_c0_g1~~TRINITY_DN2406_c0_g1_i1.p1  ORF type:complete len:212 (+),score=36.87 TRINITY_DN2406_c0_g1_i1:233-868(+)
MSSFKKIELLFFFFAFFAAVNGLRFEIHGTGSKCISEEIQGNVVVLANYSVVDYDSAKDQHGISVQVTSPYGNSLHHVEHVGSGEFGFTSHESGSYIACFWVSNPPSHGDLTYIIDIDWKVGVATKDWEQIARKEKLEGVELELMRLESAVQAIHENLIYLKNKEAAMREVSETTNSRVAWFSIMSLAICLVVSAWQLWHLTRFFEKKKLI